MSFAQEVILYSNPEEFVDVVTHGDLSGEEAAYIWSAPSGKLAYQQHSLNLAQQPKEEVVIFPNPTTGPVYCKGARSFSYRIYGSRGNLIEKGKLAGQGLPFEALSPGVYILKLKKGKREISKKIIKKPS